jgi:hypothetical protein
VHPRALAPSADETGAQQELQVLAGVRDALADLVREVLHPALALGEDIHQLGAPAVAERLGHRCERVVAFARGG